MVLSVSLPLTPVQSSWRAKNYSRHSREYTAFGFPRSPYLSLRPVLMDTINQLAAVFHLHMYHCPAATPLKWLARSNALLAKYEQKHSVIAIWKTILAPPRRGVFGMLQLFFTHELIIRLINARINSSGISSALPDVLMLKSNINEKFLFYVHSSVSFLFFTNKTVFIIAINNFSEI